uniref:STY4851/ECs_5259 family protein n=1 Tax=Rheinheimera sp. TaxID=1869214 RepID=UPI004047A832
MNTQQWITEFLFTRALFQGPAGQPLYAYQVTEEEYVQLIAILKPACFNTHPAFTKPHPTAACFCLFVAEYYRRYYNSNWSWSGPEDILGIKIAQEDRAILVQRGLEYWKRELKTHDKGYNYLGSLFAEGGLPWPLVGNEQHGFGKAIKRGIKNFYRSEDLRRSLTDLMLDYQKELPQSFQNFETIQLLAAIVHQLMSYAQKIPSDYKQDPASYLDREIPDWNKAFPIPLDIANGRLLVNEWLTDAVHTEGEQKLSAEKQKAFTAEHYVSCFFPQTRFETQVFLSREISIAVAPDMLSTMRFETALYEGEKLLTKSVAVYGQVNDNGVKARLSVTVLKVLRNKPDAPLFFKLLENGRAIFTVEIDGAALDTATAPVIALEDAQCWKVVATASCKLNASVVRALLPASAKLEMDSEACTPQPFACSEMGDWYEINQNINIATLQDRFSIVLNSADEISPFKLSGTQLYADTTPQTVYLGLPKLLTNNTTDLELSQYTEYFNGTPRQRCFITAGSINYQVKDSAGNTVYRRQFGLLPADFNVTAKAANLDGMAKIGFNSYAKLCVTADASDFFDITPTADDQTSFVISARQQNKLPTALFKIGCPQNEKSILLRQRYPAAGAKLITPDDEIATSTELLLQQLTGHRLLLCASNGIAETFTLNFAVRSKNSIVAHSSKKVKISSQTETISLYGFHQDFTQLLSVTNDQDAFIELEVKSHKTWVTLFIRRYNARLIREGDSYLAVTFNHFNCLKNTVDQELHAMSLSDPLKTPVSLEKHQTEGVATGLYLTEKLYKENDLWLVYSPDQSSLSFRPLLFVSLDKATTNSEKAITTLHSAALAFHPVTNPDVINDVIAQMANDFHHSGWQYLAALKQNFASLPLSTFEAWKALAQCPAALALAIFRLELDESFCLRLRDELAVMFETIPLATWISVRKAFKAILKATGLPDSFIESTIKNRDGVMRMVVSGFDHITEYLDTGNTDALRLPPLQSVLPIWYQQLRRDHVDDEWPETLKAPLRAWLNKTDLPEHIKHLTGRNFTDSVTYLPIFMAYVSVGAATLEQLDGNLTLIKFQIKQHAEFDRRWFLDLHALMVAYITKNKKD